MEERRKKKVEGLIGGEEDSGSQTPGGKGDRETDDEPMPPLNYLDDQTIDPQNSVNYLQVHNSNVFESLEEKKLKNEIKGVKVFKKALKKKLGDSGVGPRLSDKK